MGYAARYRQQNSLFTVYQRHHRTGGPPLKLIKGGLDRRFRIGGCQLAVTPLDRPPENSDAVVKEEDTYLVLGDEPLVIGSDNSYETLIDEIINFSPREPGTVLVQHGTPLKLFAIIHDLEQEPNWREAWIVLALMNVLRLTREYPIRQLTLPVLGQHHGTYSTTRFTHTLCNLLETQNHGIQHLWLTVARPELRKTVEYLERRV